MNQTSILSFDQAMIQCTQTLQAGTDPEQSLTTLLKILGEFYQADSSYIFEFEEEKQIFESNYQWNSKEEVEFSNTFGDLPFYALEYFSTETFPDNDPPLMTFLPEEFPESPLSQFFHGVNNILISPMFRKGVTTGFVGITNVNFQEFDSRLFSCAILFIQECLQKREMQLQLAMIHNLDPLTGFFNKAQYGKKLKLLEEKPPKQLGIVFLQLTGLEKTGEIYGSKYVDVKIKNAANIMCQFFDYPFYRIEQQKFICFVLNDEKASFLSVVDQLRMESSSNSDACFTVGHTWCSGTIDIHQEITRSNSGLAQNVASSKGKSFLSPTECLSNDLTNAIQGDCFQIYLQPKVTIATGKIHGAEALVRRLLLKNELLVPPDTFVPLYENHSIIRNLDLHVLEKVCQILASWQKEQIEIPISVNFSRVTLLETGIEKEIAQICDNYAVPRHLVEIEITERLGATEDDTLIVDGFQKEGLSLVLDDFGSTYSNFLTLTKIDVKEIKIDHSLIENMQNNSKNRKILKSIINMCHALKDTRSLAEGIETQEQRDILAELNCQVGQGFFYSPPIPREEFYQKYFQP
ncbi:MAG: EAL domain-containing protein [Eubacteriales bacterium]